jgi:hypothetical protein
LKTFTVTNDPGQARVVGVAGAEADVVGAARAEGLILGRGGGTSQMGVRTHMSITYSSRSQQEATPSSTGGQTPPARGRQPASPSAAV